MSIVTLAEYRAFAREVHDTSLDPVLADALQAAQEQVETFIGFDLSEFEEDVPATLRQVIKTMAMLMVDDVKPDTAEQLRGQVERALRPYRREPGARAA